MKASATNPVRLFQDFQRIYGFCPCCGSAFRLSDASLYYRSAPPLTPWDALDDELAKLERAEEALLEAAGRLRELARTDGQKERDRRLKSLMTFFRRRRIALRDMKLIFHPVNYVVFHGLSTGRCTAIEFLDSEPTSARHEQLQRSIQKTVDAGNYCWDTVVIDDDGRVRCT